MSNTYHKFFPYDQPREAQDKAIQFALDSFESGKRFVVIEAGTGVGKSAIGLTISRHINSQENELPEAVNRGTWYLPYIIEVEI